MNEDGGFDIVEQRFPEAKPILDRLRREHHVVEGALLQLRGEARIVENDHWFAGATYQFLDSSFAFETSQVVPGLPDLAARFRSAGFGPHATYDSRDSNYYPRSGQQFRIGWLNYGRNLGTTAALVMERRK